MWSVRFHQHGGLDVLRYEEAPQPDLAPGDVPVRVRACALNHLDLWARRGLPNIRIPMPHIAGSDIAGEVIGSAANDVAIGRRVMLQPGLSCGHGARVFATAGSDAKLERARALGAVEVIHHHEQDIAEEIKRVTNRQGVDVVIEHVGEATWPKSVRSLARGGRLVTCGATTGRHGILDLAAVFSKQLTIHGSYMGTKGELLRVARYFFAGQLKPVIDRTYPLAEAGAAHRRMEESGQFGKIVLELQ